MKNTALIMIDLQNDYFPKGRMELVAAEEAAGKAKLLLEYARKHEVVVVFLQHIAMQPGATFFLSGTRGIEIHDSLQPMETEKVFRKHFPNSFRETGLEAYLQDLGITQLVLCGMMTHMCVDATVRAAFDKGYSCILSHDACATTALQFQGESIAASHVHGSFMAALGAIYAQVATAEECIQMLVKQSQQ